MYEIEITPKNENADSKYFNKWIRENYGSQDFGVSYDENDLPTVMLSVEPDQATIDAINSFYQSLTETDIIPAAPVLPIYSRMQRDGYEYAFGAKASYFGIRYKAGELTDENILYIYKRLSQPMQMMENGDYTPALLFFQNDIVAPNATDISNGYTQEIHDSIVNDIQAYLDNN